MQLGISLALTRALGVGGGVSDVVIYGATPAGVFAAVAAARNGSRVTIYEPTYHLGGMATGGISHTDWRVNSISYRMMGPITGEYLQRAGSKLGLSTLGSASQQWSFPCSVFSAVMREMLAEVGVRVHFGYRVTSVQKTGTTITSLSFGDLVVTGAEFIDASYDGDLMAGAGVTYFVGREDNTVYGETNNGTSTATTYGSTSPYNIAGDAGSGLLPNIEADTMPAVGTGDSRVQAYSYRLSMTNDPAWRVTIPEPDTYNPLYYEFLGRRFANVPPTSLDDIFGRYTVQGLAGENREDWNDGGLTLDVPNWGNPYPDGSWTTRDAIKQQYTDYTLGLFKWFQLDSRVPSGIKTELQDWGFVAGEFRATAGMSPQLYVRSGRRMRGRTVIRQQDIMTPGAVSDPIAYGLYALDTHRCSLRWTGTVLQAEGNSNGGTPLTVAPISHECLLPDASECTNLQAVYCGSYTHIAYASLRIENVMATLGEAAGYRAALAVANAVPSGDITGADIASLQTIGRASAQYLGPTGTSTLANGTSQVQTLGTIDVVGQWTYAATPIGFVNGGNFNDGNTSKGSKTLKATFAAGALGGPGVKKIFLNLPALDSDSPIFDIEVKHASTTETIRVNILEDWFWKEFGTWAFYDDGTEYVLFKNVNSTARVRLNAVGWQDVAWTPTDLGDDIYDFWDAEQADTLSLTVSAVDAWTSVKNGYAATALTTVRPAYSASSFNSRPGVTMDGISQCLTYAGVGNLPTGSTAGSIWALVDQQALVADVTARHIATYGGNASTSRRQIRRSVVSGNNRAAAGAGDGSTEVLSNAPTTDFSGRHIVRGQFGTTVQCSADDVTGSGTAVNMATGTTRLRIGANTADTASGFFQGVFSWVGFTKPLSTENADRLRAYLKARQA